jgi:UDP-glucuronate 4-epimerase
MLPLQTGDVPNTCADVSDLFEQFQYKPSTTVAMGVSRFVDWYREYFKDQA